MSDESSISWTDATEFLCFNEGKVRTRRYHRKRTDRPGTRERRLMRAKGFHWCGRCRDWLPFDEVRNGLCRSHRNEQYREWYADRGSARIVARVAARRAAETPITDMDRALIIAQFDDECAYCGGEATTWDHIVPILSGGPTHAWNMVPCCKSCNSSKGAKPVHEWAEIRGIDPERLLAVVERAAVGGFF